MSTSDFGAEHNNIPGAGDTSGALNAALASMPDPAALEAFANEYLRQTGGYGASGALNTDQVTLLPGAVSAPSQATLPAAPYNAAPASTLTQLPSSPPTTAIPGVLTEANLAALPATLQTGGVDPRGAGPYANGLTSIPGADAFGFLQDIRPLVSAAQVPTTPSLPAIAMPTDASLRPVENALLGPQALPATGNAGDLASPLVPGAVTRTGDMGDPLSYAFVRDARPLLSFDAVPKLEPFSYVPDAGAQTSWAAAPYDVNAVRRDFPILEEQVNGRQLVWLDNAATTQKPQLVIDRISYYYQHENSNIHRAAHTLAARSTDAYEGARDKVAQFINASSSKDIIFVRGATEGINLIAQTWAKKNIQKDDEIVITWLEHHANIVPWQMLCAEKGARLRVAPVDNDGQVLLDEYEKLLGPKTKLVSLAQVSNALGTVTPVNAMVAAAHRYGAKVVVDGAQAISHMPIDVQAYDCDFYVFSGHKVFAPTGIGVVYGKPEVLEHMPPWQGGGNMIVDVTFEKTVYHGAPGRFEAGTGSIAPAVGLGAAIDYLNSIGMQNIARYEHDLLNYAIDALKAIPGLHLIGTTKEKASVLSFVLDGFRTEEVGTALNQEGIAVRSGHHCAQPILRRFGLESTVRPSLALYNTCEEVDKLIAAVWNIKQGRAVSVV
ncbi:MAG TPA: family 2A encapsulin nanocompartment cargo protein cysteine desulfurase [Capsulimonadaceae bacterium]|jgi:cysteine desulfurase/selenocysteine lyase